MAGRRFVFVSHVAAPAGAELLLLRLLSDRGREQEAAAILLEDGELATALRRVGVPTTVLDQGARPRFSRDDGVAAAARSLKPVWAAARGLAAVVRRDDVVVACSQKAFVIAVLAKAMRPRMPLVWWLHDILSREHFSAFAIRTVVAASRLCCDRVVCTSPEARDAFVASGGHRGRSSVVEPGIDLDVFAPPAADGTATREAAAGRPVVIQVSRISPWKGQMTLIEALPGMPDVDLWIVGKPLFGEEAFQALLERRVAELGVGDRVRFLGHSDDVPGLLRRASIFVHMPTAPEPFGQVVVEAMASGLPIVTTRAGAPGRIVSETFGTFVAPRDAAGLAEAIGSLVQDRGRMAAMGSAAHEAARRYDLRAMRRAFFAELSEV